jgi:multiple sugar transport system permease protein
MSFHEWGIFGAPKYIGAQNYVTLWNDDTFWDSLWHTLYFVILSTPPLVVLGLLLATGLNQKFRGKSIARGMIFFPYLLTVSIVGAIWRWMLQRNYGLVNYYLGKLGFSATGWLTDASTAMPAVAIATIWWTVGFNVIVFLAALQDIPEQLYEAARIDGADGLRSFFRITVPMLRPTMFFVIIMQIISSFQVFGQVYVMTGGGPYGTTRTMVQYLYEQGFRYFRMGYASAMAYVLFVIMLVLTLVQWKIMGSKEV